MIFKLKQFLYNILTKTKNPYFIFLLLPILSRSNLYAEKKYFNKELLKCLITLKGYSEFKISSTGVLILFYEKSVVKIPLGVVSTESLLENWKNYKKIKKSFLNHLVAYKLESHPLYYKMDRLEQMQVTMNDISFLLSSFSKERRVVNLSALKNNLFHNLSKLENICNIKLLFPINLELESVIMHGDLTQYNIMKNSDGNIVLIDLDRFTFHGILNIDYLHFIVDKGSKEEKISFFKYLNHMYDKDSFDNVSLYLYLLYRVNNEYSDTIKLNQKYYDEFITLVKRFSACITVI
jgi:hypothetical protein